MELVIVAAVSDSNVIGKAGKLPWEIPKDMQHFRELTIGYPVIMGRRTYESIPTKYRPLPYRLNVVLSRNRFYKPLGARTASSLEDAIELISSKPGVAGINYDRAFVIGGQSVYEQALPKADRLEITHVHRKVDGDTYFPNIDEEEWDEEERVGVDDISFVTYVRRRVA